MALRKLTWSQLNRNVASSEHDQSLFKGTVQQDFRPPVCFIIQTSLGQWPMDKHSFVFGLVFAKIFEFFLSSAHHYTARSQVLHTIIVHGVKWLFRILFKGTVKRYFLPVFSQFESALATKSGVKIFSIFPRYLSFLRLTPRSIILCRAWLHAVSYCGKSLYCAEYCTSLFLKTFCSVL